MSLFILECMAFYQLFLSITLKSYTMFIEQQKNKRSKYSVLGPDARKNLTVIAKTFRLYKTLNDLTKSSLRAFFVPNCKMSLGINL